MVPDNGNRILVGSHGPVGSEAEELAADGPRGGGHDLLRHRQGGAANVVDNPYRKMVFGLIQAQVVEDRLYHGGIKFLLAQSVAAAHNKGRLLPFHEYRADILVQGFSQGARLLGPVQDRQAAAGLRQHGEEVLRGEGPVQAHLNQADFFAPLVEVVDRLFNGLAGGAHANDDPLGIGGAAVVEKAVATAGKLVDLLHYRGDYSRDGLVVGIGGFPVLEVDIGVLVGAPQRGPLRA